MQVFGKIAASVGMPSRGAPAGPRALPSSDGRWPSAIASSLLLAVLLAFPSLAWGGEPASRTKKKYPHPHAVHLDMTLQSLPEISAEEIGSWPEFLRLLQRNLDRFSEESDLRKILGAIRPDAVTEDERLLVLHELNRLLAHPSAGLGRKPTGPVSTETRRLEARYRKSRDPDDLKWLNRSLFSDLLPQIPRRERLSGVPQITCATCHESYVPLGKDEPRDPSDAIGDERQVANCFARAALEGKSMGECRAMADRLKAARIDAYGPLSHTVQRGTPEDDIPFLTAIHPEKPYTFKPLLKRLVCIQCHGQGRTVDKVIGRHGELKGIPIFYGREFRQVRPEDTANAQGR